MIFDDVNMCLTDFSVELHIVSVCQT